MRMILLCALVLALCGCASVAPPLLSSTGWVPSPSCGEGRLWIDTDFALGRGIVADPDDAVAWEMIRNCANIAGVSTTAGNVPAQLAWASATSRITATPRTKNRVVAWRGQPEKYCKNPAVIGMADALENGPLTILAFGPLTNIAQIISCRPDLREKIDEIVAVGGRTVGAELKLGNGGFALREMRDLNVWYDPQAFEAVLSSGTSVRLFGFEAGVQVQLSYQQVSPFVDETLGSAVRDWAATLGLIGGGFSIPAFDPVALMGLLDPNLFVCEPVAASFRERLLEVALEQGDGGTVLWCLPKEPAKVQSRILAYLRDKPSNGPPAGLDDEEHEEETADALPRLPWKSIDD